MVTRRRGLAPLQRAELVDKLRRDLSARASEFADCDAILAVGGEDHKVIAIDDVWKQMVEEGSGQVESVLARLGITRGPDTVRRHKLPPGEGKLQLRGFKRMELVDELRGDLMRICREFEDCGAVLDSGGEDSKVIEIASVWDQMVEDGEFKLRLAKLHHWG